MQGIHPIRAYRVGRQLSQAELAGELGVSRLTVLRWENHQRLVDPDLVPVVSEKTGIPAKELRPDLIEKHEAMFGETAPESESAA